MLTNRHFLKKRRAAGFAERIKVRLFNMPIFINRHVIFVSKVKKNQKKQKKKRWKRKLWAESLDWILEQKPLAWR